MLQEVRRQCNNRRDDGDDTNAIDFDIAASTSAAAMQSSSGSSQFPTMRTSIQAEAIQGGVAGDDP